jgi:hypothetical protein
MGKLSVRTLTFIACLLPLVASSGWGASNIDPNSTGNLFGWSENGGWLNMRGNGATGVRVNGQFLQGFAWHENFGWINFGDGSPSGSQYSNSSAADFGVNSDSLGRLSGYAWGENVGWVVFDTPAPGGRVIIDQATGKFRGYAWGENVGWIAFESVNQAVVAQTIANSRVGNWTLY